MRFSKLKSLGHNLADSMASGIGFVIGIYDMNVFGEAAASSEGHITVDFLTATTTGSPVSPSLLRAISLYRDELPNFCAKHGVQLSQIQTLQVRFGTDAAYGTHFSVTVANVDGKRSTDQYIGSPGKRLHRARA